MSLSPVPDSEVATVVTHLVMDGPPASPPASGLVLQQWRDPDVEAFRSLFRQVGERWLWYSRLTRTDQELGAILSDPSNEVLRVHDGAQIAGFTELHFGEPGVAGLTFLGLVEEYVGRGHGGWLLKATLAKAWDRPGIRKVRVNTCTLDHPAALPNYLRAGFRVTGRSIETFPDPRLLGILPMNCAPQVPLIGTPGATRRCE